MAKARNTTPVKVRAIKAWAKATGFFPDTVVKVAKARSKKLIRVSYPDGKHAYTWSYKGGSLRRVEA